MKIETERHLPHNEVYLLGDTLIVPHGFGSGKRFDLKVMAPIPERRFMSRVGFVLRNLPRLIRDAWRDSRFA